MQYPLISEYLTAIQDAHDNLDKLNHLVPVLDKHGEPYRSSGAFAIVFKMKDEQTGKCYALKCFTEDQEGRAEAYRQIAEELEFVDSPYITSVKYLEKELFVDSNCEDDEFPVLLMDWIEGETMETYIAENYTDNYEMSMLCYRFCKMAAWLRSQSFAHGDIKPDNIIVRPDGTLTLVDYDGMFVPAMKGQKSPTIGTKDFSHPLRTMDDFDETIDDFSLASIALSLKAISLDSSLLQSYRASDRLLFSATDYLDLSKSKIFAALQSLFADVEARTLLSMFLLASAQKDLSMCSFRLFGLQKPKEKEVWSTEVTKEDLKNAVEDEFGVKYSKDWKRLLKAPIGLKGKYSIREGVKVVGNDAFQGCGFLTNIDLPESLTSIGRNAFFYCDSLTSIIIPNGVTSIGDHAFSKCNSLKSIIIPDSVTSIGNYAFLCCDSLTSINIPNGVTSIGEGAFGDCGSLTSINIPDSVTSIGYYAFSYCDSLTSINIPNGVTSIGDFAFENCHSLTSINIPDGVTSIGDFAFSSCYSLTSINIPNSVTSIGYYAFKWCKSLMSINIPDSVTSIGNGAFSDCKSLLNINIPNGVTSIGDSVFVNCNSLISITIPSSVIAIGMNPFRGCHADLKNESKAFIYEHNVLFDRDKTAIISYRAKEANYVIPDSVISIGEYAFSECNSLTSIIIPDSVTSIGYSTFSECKSLTNINIPDSVTSIGDFAFSGCDSLTSINIPNGVTNIGYSTFSECKSLTNINIPDSVTSIGDFAFSGCDSLTSINIPNGVTNIGQGAFKNCGSLSPQVKSDIIQRFGGRSLL